ETATIDLDSEKSSSEEITKKIENICYGVVRETIELDVFGMTCAACSPRIEKVLNKQEGIDHATVNLTTETASIEYNPALLDTQGIIEKIKQTGYDAKPKAEATEKQTHKEKEMKHMQIKLIIAAVISAPLLVTMLVHLFNMNIPSIFIIPWFQFALSTPVQFIIICQFYVGEYKNLRNGGANMDVLVALGTSAAYFYSLYESFKTIGNPANEPHLYFETSAVLITLILFGKYLEARAKNQTTNALSSLLNLQAKEARVIRDGEEMMISVADVVVEVRLVAKPGQKEREAGRAVKGRPSVDESMLTGESIPIEKDIDATVIGSTINKNGTIEMEATKVGKDTALASIVKVVEDAQGSKAPIQRLADVISGYFVPIVVGIAILTFIVWISFVQPGQYEPALVASIAVLVIACP